MNRRVFERLIIFGSIASLVFGAVIYLTAQPQSKADFHKILFEKLLLAVIVASAGVILKRWVDDWNTKRKFFLDQQISSANQLRVSASKLYASAGRWAYEFFSGEQDKKMAKLLRQFEQQLDEYTNALAAAKPFVSAHFSAAAEAYFWLIYDLSVLDRLPTRPKMDRWDCLDFLQALFDSLETEFIRLLDVSLSSPPTINLTGIPAAERKFEQQAMIWLTKRAAESAALSNA